MIVVEILIFTYLLFVTGYIFLLSVFGRFSKQAPGIYLQEDNGKYNKIAILIPAYKEDGIIISSVAHYFHLDYPKEDFQVFVIADSLRENTLQLLSALPITVIPVSFEKSTKAKSLNRAFEMIEDHYDIALICDADNVLQSDFLQKINHGFNQGEYVIQAHRVAKNMNTPFAVLDSASELINNHIFRKGSNALGLSSPVIGSGMAFKYDLLKEILARNHAVGGFDKVLQLAVVERGYTIKFLGNALLFDEKVENPATFGRQRRRWLSSQFLYLRIFFLKGIRQLFKGNINYFNLAVIHNLLLPRVFLLGILLVLFLFSLFFSSGFVLSPWYWGSLCFVYYVSLVIALPAKFFNMKLLKAMMSLPKAFWIMLMSLLRIKGANQYFIHTAHFQEKVDNPLFYADEM